MEEFVNKPDDSYKVESCCGHLYNNPRSEILNAIFVDDDYVIRHALSWMKNNINSYKFIGDSAREIQEKIIGSSVEIMEIGEIQTLLREFFELFANNPFCVENGMGIVDESYIVSTKMNCYFVVYKTNMIIPLGCLADFVHDKTAVVIDEFVTYAKGHAEYLIQTTKESISTIEENSSWKKNRNPATFLRVFLGGTTLLFGIVYVMCWIKNIDWANLGHILEGADTFSQMMGFIAKGYGIGIYSPHNGYLIGMGVVWLIHILISNCKVFKEFVNAKNYAQFRRVEKRMDDIRGYLPSIEGDVKGASEFVLENMESARDVVLKPRWTEKRWGPAISIINNNRDSMFSVKMEGILARTIWLVIMFVYMISSIIFWGRCSQESYQLSIRNKTRELQIRDEFSELRGSHQCVVIEDANVYTRNYAESLVWYQLQAGTRCKVLIKPKDGLYTKVSFLTEYGYLEGWIDNNQIKEYLPYEDPSYERFYPLECSASSQIIGQVNYGPDKAADGIYSTSWQEAVEGSGHGEWISFKYPGARLIKTIGIYNGSGVNEEMYYANVRPIDISIYFYVSDQQVNSMSYTLEDGVFGLQWIDLNTPVVADSIKIVIDSVRYGNEYDDACIAEVEVYIERE